VIDISSTSADKRNKPARPLAYVLTSCYFMLATSKEILQ